MLLLENHPKKAILQPCTVLFWASIAAVSRHNLLKEQPLVQQLVI
jgi:hypothetical protein